MNQNMFAEIEAAEFELAATATVQKAVRCARTGDVQYEMLIQVDDQALLLDEADMSGAGK